MAETRRRRGTRGRGSVNSAGTRARTAETPAMGPPSDERRRAVLWMLAIAALAAAVRIAYIVEVLHHPLQMMATADPRIYDMRALEILAGGWLPREVFFHSSPVYPYILAGVYALFGHSYLAVRLIQSAVGTATCLILFSITRSLFGLREAVVAGLLSALYVAFVFFDSELLMITFVVFFSMLAIHILLRRRHGTGAVLAAGLLTGLAALGKPNILLFVPAVLLWFWWTSRRYVKASGTAASPAPRSAVRSMLVFTVGAALVVAPFTISNYRVSGDFVATTSNGGINFYIGNNENADGTFLVDQSMRTDLYKGSKRRAELESGRELRSAEVSSFWLAKGLRYAMGHPAREIRLLGRKLLLFWNAYEIPNHYDLNFFKTFSRVLRFDPFVFAWMIPFGFLGIYVSRRRWREFLPLYMFAGTYMVSLVPFFVTSRYRLPVVPVMLIFSAHGVSWIIRRLAAREKRGWTGAVVVLASSFVFVNLPLVDFTLGPSRATLGGVYRDMGRHEEAAEQFKLATEESPGFDLAYSNLGSELGRLGRYAEAETVLTRAIEINPLLVPAYSNLGVIYVETGRPEDARRAFTKAVELDADHDEAWEGLARLGVMTGDSPLLERALLELLRINPDDGAAHWNLAVLYSTDPATWERSAQHARMAAALLPAVRTDAEQLLEMLRSNEGRDR